MKYLIALLAFAVAAVAADVAVPAGKQVTLTVTASGTAPFTYQWKKDGVAISGATSASYVIASWTAASAGAYTVTVTNAVGSTTSSATNLSKATPPVLTEIKVTVAQ